MIINKKKNRKMIYIFKILYIDTIQNIYYNYRMETKKPKKNKKIIYQNISTKSLIIPIKEKTNPKKKPLKIKFP